jgi:hypothetical protein
MRAKAGTRDDGMRESQAELEKKLEARTRELAEAFERQSATSEVLELISSSPGNLQPVFETILANAVRICEARFGTLYLREGDALRVVAMHDAPPLFAEERRRNPVIHPRPDTTLGRAVRNPRAGAPLAGGGRVHPDPFYQFSILSDCVSSR